MTTKQAILRNRLLAKIHASEGYKIRKAADAWQDFLYANFGEDSSAKLGISELKNLLDFLRGRVKTIASDPESRNILRHRTHKAAKPQSEGEGKHFEFATGEQLFAIDKLWFERARNKNDVFSKLEFINRIIGRRPFPLNTMSVIEAQKVILALKNLKEAKGDARL